MYVTGLTDKAVGWYERNSSTGSLTYLGVLKDEVNGIGYARSVIPSGDGKYVYVTGSGNDAISWYERPTLVRVRYIILRQTERHTP